jgi:hypothetical protein
MELFSITPPLIHLTSGSWNPNPPFDSDLGGDERPYVGLEVWVWAFCPGE